MQDDDDYTAALAEIAEHTAAFGADYYGTGPQGQARTLAAVCLYVIETRHLQHCATVLDALTGILNGRDNDAAWQREMGISDTGPRADGDAGL